MKIYSSIGSKERFLEMFQRVNKIILNEDMTQGNYQEEVVKNELTKLIDGNLNIDETNSQTVDNESHITIVASGNDNEKVTFRFKITSNEGEQEGVFTVGNAELIGFEYNSSGYNIEIPEGASILTKMNQEYGQDMIDVVGKYADAGESAVEMDEMYEEAVKFIDKIPYRKGSEEIQTQKAYFDEKPVNPKLRVNSPELQKFVSENDDNDDVVDDDYTNDTIEDDPLAMPPDYLEMKKNKYNTKIEPEEETEDDPKDVELYNQAVENLINDNNRRNRNSYYYPTRYEIDKEFEKLKNLEQPESQSAEKSTGLGNMMAKGKKRVYPAWADKFLPESDTSIDVDKITPAYYNKLTPERRQKLINMADEMLKKRLGVKVYQMSKEEYYELVRQTAMKLFHGYMEQLNETDYPQELGIASDIKTSTKYPKPKKKHKTKKLSVKTGVSESVGGDRYEDIVFLQGDAAFQPLEILETKGEDAALEYLKQWHYSGEHATTNELGHGSSDHIYEKDGYIMSWNPKIGYIGLQYDMSQMNEEENTGASQETADEISKLAQDKEEEGEVLIGGKGDGKSPLDFDPKQILMGLEVEKEHTDDPLVAIEIVMDHLSEDSEYYTEKDTPEASAQFGAASDASEDGDDEEKTDELLGYKPINVGDNMNEIVGAAGAVPAVAAPQETDSDNNDYVKLEDYEKKDVNTLSDSQKKEYFDLWTKYRPKK